MVSIPCVIDFSQSQNLSSTAKELYALTYNGLFHIDYIQIKDWTVVAHGLGGKIGIELKISVGDAMMAYTPTLNDNPDDFDQIQLLLGVVFLATEDQVIWIKPRSHPITLAGDIKYTYA